MNGFLHQKKKFISNDHLENLGLFLGENIPRLDFKVKKLPREIINEAKKLLPNSNYVGFSITQGNEYRKKSWSIYKFTSLANKVTTKK